MGTRSRATLLCNVVNVYAAELLLDGDVDDNAAEYDDNGDDDDDDDDADDDAVDE